MALFVLVSCMGYCLHYPDASCMMLVIHQWSFLEFFVYSYQLRVITKLMSFTSKATIAQEGPLLCFEGTCRTDHTLMQRQCEWKLNWRCWGPIVIACARSFASAFGCARPGLNLGGAVCPAGIMTLGSKYAAGVMDHMGAVQHAHLGWIR